MSKSAHTDHRTMDAERRIGSAWLMLIVSGGLLLCAAFLGGGLFSYAMLVDAPWANWIFGTTVFSVACLAVSNACLLALSWKRYLAAASEGRERRW